MENDPQDDGLRQLTEEERAALSGLVRSEAQRAADQVEALERELTSIVEASEHANIDDEHDPEGATIAYERALVISLLGTARGTVGELAEVESTIDSAAFGRCEVCGRPIAVERLFARPTARTCVRCA